MFTHTFLNNISNVFQTWSQLLSAVVAQRNVVRDVALVAREVECFLELVLGFIKFAFLEEHATLSNDGLGGVRRHLGYQGLCLLDLLQLVLD